MLLCTLLIIGSNAFHDLTFAFFLVTNFFLTHGNFNHEVQVQIFANNFSKINKHPPKKIYRKKTKIDQ